LTIQHLCDAIIDPKDGPRGARAESPAQPWRVVRGAPIHIEAAAVVLHWRRCLAEVANFEGVEGLELVPADVRRQVREDAGLELVLQVWVVQEGILQLVGRLLLEGPLEIALNLLRFVAPGRGGGRRGA